MKEVYYQWKRTVDNCGKPKISAVYLANMDTKLFYTENEARENLKKLEYEEIAESEKWFLAKITIEKVCDF